MSDTGDQETETPAREEGTVRALPTATQERPHGDLAEEL